MSVSLTDFLTLVIQNNPVAISQKLVDLGYLDTPVDDPEQLRAILLELAKKTVDGGEKLLQRVLNVPLNEYGENAMELLQLYTSKANQSLFTSYLQSSKLESKPKTNLRKGIVYFEWNADKWLRILGFAVLALVGIFILKKLFSSDE